VDVKSLKWVMDVLVPRNYHPSDARGHFSRFVESNEPLIMSDRYDTCTPAAAAQNYGEHDL
jgi:hypothetical protein